MSKSVWMKMSCIVVNYKNMKTPVNYKDGGFTLCSARPIEVHGEREPAVSFDIHLDQIQDRHPMSILYSSTHYDTITLVDIRETHIVPFTLTSSFLLTSFGEVIKLLPASYVFRSWPKAVRKNELI